MHIKANGNDRNGGNMKKYVLAVMVVALFVMTGAAFAGTATDNITVSATVIDTCRITTTANDISFGDYDPTDTSDNTAGSSSIEFRCTKNLTYYPYITGSRTMTDGTNNLTYELYSDVGSSIPWATSKATATAIVSPGNAKRTIPINGKITAEQDVPAGYYSEDVVVTIEY